MAAEQALRKIASMLPAAAFATAQRLALRAPVSPLACATRVRLTELDAVFSAHCAIGSGAALGRLLAYANGS
jgi:hypothetical protein